MTPHTFVTVFGWLTTIYYSICLLTDAHAWAVTSRLYSRIPWAQGGRMLALVIRSRIHYYLWSPILPATALCAFSLAGIHFPLVFILSLSLFWIHILVYQALPPAVLLLGTSCHETLNLRHNLERALYPYRVVVFLEPAVSLTPQNSPFTRKLFEWDNLRTSDGDWRSSVFGLVASVPVIVVDARISTEGVVEEIDRVFRHQLNNKAVFVADDRGMAPALVDAQVRVQAGALLSEAQVADVLKRSGLRYTTSPDDNPILRRWSR